jgi:cysteinyl-tRNA synthetase
MSKSAGGFLRLQSLLDRNYDPLAYRFFCLGAHYRARLNFSWEAMDAATTALNRLRAACHQWGEPGEPDQEMLDTFAAQIADDLNMPRALAVVWDLVRSDLSPATKKGTLLRADQVLGLGLAEWQPLAEDVPAFVTELVAVRQRARAERRWKDADALRAQVTEAGFSIEDTPEGPRVRLLSAEER